MSTAAQRKITVTYTGDVGGTQELTADENSPSPAGSLVYDLALGANTIAVPTGAEAATILKASDNTTALTLKGVTGDTGVALHLTNPDSISLATAQTTFVLTADAAMSIRIFWS